MTNSVFDNTVLALNSPFPWAPGHAYMELEFLCYKVLESSVSPRKYLYPWLEGPIANAIKNKFEDILSSINISIITQPIDIYNALQTCVGIDASVSSIKYIKRDDISQLHYRNAPTNDVYSQIQPSRYKYLPLYVSNQGLQTDYQDYCSYYVKHNSFHILQSNIRKPGRISRKN